MLVMDRLFAALVAAVLVLVVITAYWEHRPQWMMFQRQYYIELARAVDQPVMREEIEALSREIKQDWIPALDVTDRCRTCHIAVEDPNFKEAEEPLRTHPKISAHPPAKFGCTTCHGGQGLATNMEEAHGHVENWNFPLLPAQVTEGSCGKCHLAEDIPEAPVLTEGRRLVRAAGCVGCHEIQDLKPQMIGPDLTGLGSKVSRAWLKKWLKRPKDYLPETYMPDFSLSDEEIDALVEFLMTSRSEYVEITVPPAESEESDDLYETGRIRFRESRCITCHAIEGKGGTIGPDLTFVADKVSKKWLYAWLSNPKAYFPRTRMSHFNFNESDLVAVVEYLWEEMGELWPEERSELFESPPFDPEKAARGKEVAKKYGCYGCHELPEGVKGGEIAPDLSRIGSKPVYRLDFRRTDIERSLPNWLFVKVKYPRVFADNLKMPDYEFTDRQAALITAALMGYADRPKGGEYVVPGPKAQEYNPQGPFAELLKEYECLVCHTIRGRGGNLAPDLSIEGSIVQRKWLVDYLLLPYAVRPTLEERMPRFQMGREHAELIADYIFLVLRDDMIPSTIGPLDEAMVQRGKALYYEKYACASCHIVGDSGGYYGPALNRTGERLNPAWVYTRLLDPQKYEPTSREPNLNIPEQDALALTAFLMTLKEDGA